MILKPGVMPGVNWGSRQGQVGVKPGSSSRGQVCVKVRAQPESSLAFNVKPAALLLPNVVPACFVVTTPVVLVGVVGTKR